MMSAALSWADGFDAPGRLWGLAGVGALILAYAATSLVRRRYTIRFTNLELLSTVAPRRPGWRRHVSAALLLGGLGLTVAAWAVPVDEVEVPKERATVVLAIDTSLSMEASDVPPSRIDAARQAAHDFVDGLPRSINVGLVTFDGVARVKVTPTTDRTVLTRAIDTMELGPATAIGEAVFAALDAVRTAPVPDGEDPIPAAIIVMTDGKTTVGRPDADGAAAAFDAEIPVSTIAFGTDRGTIVIDGDLQPVPVEESSLRLVAERTGGRFFRATSLDELTAVYDDIGSSVGFDVEDRAVTDRFVGYSLALLGLAAATGLLWQQRLP